jgi:hypothetical protein
MSFVVTAASVASPMLVELEVVAELSDCCHFGLGPTGTTIEDDGAAIAIDNDASKVSFVAIEAYCQICQPRCRLRRSPRTGTRSIMTASFRYHKELDQGRACAECHLRTENYGSHPASFP